MFKTMCKCQTAADAASGLFRYDSLDITQVILLHVSPYSGSESTPSDTVGGGCTFKVGLLSANKQKEEEQEQGEDQQQE